MASEIFLNGSVRQNLLSLQDTVSLAGRTQSRLASGLKVASAIDDAVAYFTSKSLADRAQDIGERKSAIDQGISTLKAAVNATEAIDSILKQLKGILISAKTATVTEKTSLQTQFNSLSLQLNLLLADGTYNGINLVNATTTTLTVQFSNLTTSKLDIVGKELNASIIFALTFAASIAASEIIYLGVATDITDGVAFTTAGASHFDAGITKINAAIDTVRGAAKTLGANVSFLQTRLDFSKVYINTTTEGADKLRLADLNEEGANLVALQTRQQLSLQSLALAGQAEQAVLTLFR
jgi:flagellin-like hook-associated protein FlgL